MRWCCHPTRALWWSRARLAPQLACEAWHTSWWCQARCSCLRSRVTCFHAMRASCLGAARAACLACLSAVLSRYLSLVLPGLVRRCVVRVRLLQRRLRGCCWVCPLHVPPLPPCRLVTWGRRALRYVDPNQVVVRAGHVSASFGDPSFDPPVEEVVQPSGSLLCVVWMVRRGG